MMNGGNDSKYHHHHEQQKQLSQDDSVKVGGTKKDENGHDGSNQVQSANVVEEEEEIIESDHDRAVREAEECLEALRRECNTSSNTSIRTGSLNNVGGFQLEGFNLLGVVANPRVGGSSTSSSRHVSSSSSSLLSSAQPTTGATTAAVAAGGGTATTSATTTAAHHTDPGTAEHQQQTPQTPTSQQQASSDFFGDAVQSLESTLHSVTEQIENLNLFLEELSRHYLGDDGGESIYLEYYLQYEHESTEAPPIPPQLAGLQLNSLQAYLEECGVLAHSFFVVQPKEHPTPTQQQQQQQQAGDASASMTPGTSTATMTTPTSIDNAAETDIANINDCRDLPEVLVQSDFDLTNPDTFMQLLMEDSTISPTATTTNTKSSSYSRSDSLYQPTQQLVPLASQDILAGHLDRVELALQAQVRSKAGAFFQETTRFSELQVLIVRLLDQVQTLRFQVKQMKASYVNVADISTLDLKRQEYQKLLLLLDAAMELVRCKASIGGLVSASDHLGAAEQIQYGRRLLTGAKNNNSGNNHEKSKEDVEIELENLVALGTCSDQFQQYQTLVIQNLSEELVELFLGWNASTTHSNNANSSNYSVTSSRRGGLGAAEEARVLEMVQALELCKALPMTGQLYIRRVQQVIRMTVRTTIAEFVVDSGGVTGMTYTAFSDCLAMLLEELQVLLQTAQSVDNFCVTKHLFEKEEQNDEKEDKQQKQKQNQRWTYEAMTSAAELAAKSIAELLRLRKEAHSLITLDEMKQLWDTCIQFTLNVEKYTGGTKAIGLRSTLLGQAKAFLERTHESNMSALVAALDSERWTQCEVSSERQAVLTRLCSGRAVMSKMTTKRTTEDGAADATNSNTASSGNSSSTGTSTSGVEKKPMADVEGVRYKVVWSCLLLVEMVMTNLSSAAHFQSLAANAVAKVAELLRLFNSRAGALVLGAGAIHSAARLKSINAKHLSLVTQCLGMILALLPHIRAALMAQLPAKQHTLLVDLDKIKKDYVDHNEKVLNKFVTIIGGIVEHGLAPRIANTDFDARATAMDKEKTKDGEEGAIKCCVFLEGVSTNTRKMHQVLNSLLPPDHLQDVFSRIFAYVDQKVPALLIAADAATSEKSNKGFINNGNDSTSSSSLNGGGNASKPGSSQTAFRFPSTDDGKRRLLLEVQKMTTNLNGLNGVHPWDFTAMTILGRELDYRLPEPTAAVEEEVVAETPTENEKSKSTNNEAVNGEAVEDEKRGGNDDDEKEAFDEGKTSNGVVAENGDGNDTISTAKSEQ